MNILHRYTRYFLFLLTASIWGCIGPEVLEYEAAGGLKVEKLQMDGKSYILISGLCMHSAMNIKEVVNFKDKDTLIIEVYITLFRKKGSSGNFDKKIEIPDSISTVLFGRNRKLIWPTKANEKL